MGLTLRTKSPALLRRESTACLVKCSAFPSPGVRGAVPCSVQIIVHDVVGLSIEVVGDTSVGAMLFTLIVVGLFIGIIGDTSVGAMLFTLIVVGVSIGAVGGTSVGTSLFHIVCCRSVYRGRRRYLCRRSLAPRRHVIAIL